MNQISVIFLAFLGGVFLAIQGGYNAQLGVLLKNPLMASLVAFFCSSVYAAILLAASFQPLPAMQQVKAVPTHLWFTGALFSVVGVSLYYYTIPKLGISSMISLGLFGQLLFSVVAGHFGWFGLAAEPVDLKRLLGIAAMVAGILLIKSK
ncbi:MAG: DMT family transporter [Roseivirga sp.]|nr:DMT family transporter [Roseivirga sp.]